jgi:hypothetical protein
MAKTTLSSEESLFTQNDFDFLLHTVGRKGRGNKRLLKILQNPDKRYHLLAEESLLRAVCDRAEEASLSTYLYYGAHIAYGLKCAGVTDPNLLASFNLSITKLAEGLNFKSKHCYPRKPYLPLMPLVGIKKKAKGHWHFQIVGDLKKACIVIEGTFRV